MKRTARLLLAASTLSALIAPTALARTPPSPPLRHVATVPATDTVVSDGRRLIVVQEANGPMRTYDIATGATRAVPLPSPYPCWLAAAHDGRALVHCPTTLTGATDRAEVVDLSTGVSTTIPVTSETANRLGAPLGRYWVGGQQSFGDLHVATQRFYVDIATGRMVLGYLEGYMDEGPDYRVRDLDTPDLNMVACGPTWGYRAIAAPPYLARYAFNVPWFWIDRCEGRRLASRIRVRRGEQEPDPTSISRRISVGAFNGEVEAYRNRDGVQVARWTFPDYLDSGGLVPEALGSRIVIIRSHPGQITRVDVAEPLKDAPPARPTRLAVRADRGMGPVHLDQTRTHPIDLPGEDVETYLGPGRLAGGVRTYRNGIAKLAIAFDKNDRAARISTRWPRATVRGHRLGLGISRLARRLPSSWHSACDGRALVHGDGPATILRRSGNGRMKATVTTAAPTGCAAR